MLKINTLSKKIILAVLVVLLAVAAFPFAGVSAAGLNAQPPVRETNFRVERLWARQQFLYQREGAILTGASSLIARVQTLIDKANSNGWDTSSIQSALNDLGAVIPAAQTAHQPGAAIITSHAGFDDNGTVTDRTTAIATVESLGQILKDTRTALNGTGKALRDALQVFRTAHPRPTGTPTP